jgi:hypothetical protein
MRAISFTAHNRSFLMTRAGRLFALILGLGALAFAPIGPLAQQPPKKAAATVKAGKGEKVCRIKMKYSGETKRFVCKKEEPCCAWHEINYVKCGSTVTGCL